MVFLGLSLGAQSLPLVPLGEPMGQRDWQVQLGAMSLVTPRSPGSDQSRLLLLPVIDAEYRGIYYLGSSRVGVGLGGGVHAYRDSTYTWDLGLGVGEGRRESRAEVLAGLGNRSPSLFGGTAFRAQSGLLSASLSVALGLKDEAGLRSTLRFGVGGRLGGPWSGGVQVSATAADARAMAYDFGVNPGQALVRAALIGTGDGRLRPGEARVWSPRGGLSETAFGGHLDYRVDAEWRWFGLLRASQLHGDAKGSPLARQADGLTFGAGFAYRF
jgi:outer membrane scaffolding protein for murein synthesis (MipA/OmpV family)